MLIRTLVFVFALGLAASSRAQTAPAAAQTATPASPSWSGSASLYTYAVPDDDNFVQPTIAADHESLHLEARFNYEDLNTASGWIGKSFNFGENVTLDITPMAGVVFGKTNGAQLAIQDRWRGGPWI